jgi:hypothetical protein
VPEGELAELSDAVPLTLVGAGRTGRYLVYCAARKDTNGDGKLDVVVDAAGALVGDALVPELMLGGGAPEAIDDLLGEDPSGRYVVTRQGGKPLLRDALTRDSLDLGALGFDDRDDVLAYRTHRALAFDPRGELLAYARKGADRVDVVLRELATGHERVVTGLSGEPYRLRFDGTGETLVVSAIASDTSENGRLDWPYRKRNKPRLTCQGGVSRFGVHPEMGDRPVSFLVSRSSAAAELAPDLAVPLGKSSSCEDQTARFRSRARVVVACFAPEIAPGACCSPMRRASSCSLLAPAGKIRSVPRSSSWAPARDWSSGSNCSPRRSIAGRSGPYASSRSTPVRKRCSWTWSFGRSTRSTRAIRCS